MKRKMVRIEKLFLLQVLDDYIENCRNNQKWGFYQIVSDLKKIIEKSPITIDEVK